MDQSKLVAEDVADGARLIAELQDRGFPITVALWAYTADLEAWQLVIATSLPATGSRSRAYRTVQEVLEDLGLRLSLSRITLIRDSDPSVVNVKALVESDPHDLDTVPIGQAEFGGRSAGSAYAYKSEWLRYGRELLTALRRYQGPYAVIPEQEVSELPSNIHVDFLLDRGDRAIAVEAKARKRPLGIADVHHAAGLYDSLRVFFPRPISLLLVSQKGFSHLAVEEWTQVHRPPLLVTWAGPQDDESLHAAINHAWDFEG